MRTKNTGSEPNHTRGQADRVRQESMGPRAQTSLFAEMLRDGRTAATGLEHGDGRIVSEVTTSSFAFAFAKAAVNAAKAARKQHLKHVVEEAERGRLEREAFRVSVHEHVKREIVRKSVEFAEILGGQHGEL